MKKWWRHTETFPKPKIWGVGIALIPGDCKT